MSAFTLRPADRADVPSLFALIEALAAYEKLSDAVVGSAVALETHLFGVEPCIEAMVAADAGKTIGFALFFTTFHTFEMQPGIYLEDLFVLPDYRSLGVGKVLLARLAKIVIDRQYARLDWSVLDWNEPAIGFYRRLGATVAETPRICRITGTALAQLAARETPHLRSAVPEDIPALFALAKANAEFHDDLPQFVGSSEAMEASLFGDRPYAETLVAEQAGAVAAFALFFTSYSTFLTQPGLYIEDLFVAKPFRRQGLGQAMLTQIARTALARNCGRVEWLVAQWNADAIAFYQRMGAVALNDWRVCKLAGSALENLAQSGG